MNFKQVQALLKTAGAELIGSRAWNSETPFSDWDYVLPLKVAIAFKERLSKAGWVVKDHDYYVAGYYLTNFEEDVTINIIGCKKNHFKHWVAASNMMKCLTVADKQQRQLLFETIFSILKRISYVRR